MAGFAVARPRSEEFDLRAAPADNPERVPFFDAVQRAIEERTRVGNDGVREEQWRTDMWARHREIERRLGRRLPLSHSLTGERTEDRDPVKRALDALIPVDQINAAILGAPGALDDDAYERHIEELRRQNPKALDGVETREELSARLDAVFRDIARRNEESFTSLGGGLGSLTGSVIGSLMDPGNLGVTIATGGAGASRPLLMRMLAQAGANMGVEALQTPGRASDAARFGGPQYGAGQAAFDIAAAGALPPVLEGAFAGGRAAVRGAWRAFDARQAGPEAEGHVAAAVRKLELAEADEAAIGPLEGLDFDAAHHALTTGGARPELEPERDLSELFAGDLSTAVNPAQLSQDTYRGRRIYHGRFDPLAVEVDPQRFQYKADGDAEGVTARLRGVERWDPTASGKVIVWEDEAGQRFIADGHQRRGLAKRLAEQGWDDAQLDGFLFRARDGWSARDVRVVAALKNIREGSGTILDAAKILRDAPSADDGSLPVTGDFMAAARGLAKLSKEAFEAVVNKVIPERYGAEIGAVAGHRPELHGNIVKLMREAEPANQDEARALVQEALLDDFIKTEGVQADLFGKIDFASTTIARAKVKAAVLRALKQDARLYAQLVRHADAIEAGGNALARDQNQAALALDRAALELVSKLSLRAGPIGEAMAEAAEAVAIRNVKPADAAKGIVARVRRAIADGERLDEVRKTRLDPDPPSQQTLEQLADFSEPGGAGHRAQTEPKPEDAEFEDEAPWLFDDAELAQMGVREDKAHQALSACAPGGGKAK